jgi:hypothetical protein
MGRAPLRYRQTPGPGPRAWALAAEWQAEIAPAAALSLSAPLSGWVRLVAGRFVRVTRLRPPPGLQKGGSGLAWPGLRPGGPRGTPRRAFSNT